MSDIELQLPVAELDVETDMSPTQPAAKKKRTARIPKRVPSYTSTGVQAGTPLKRLTTQETQTIRILNKREADEIARVAGMQPALISREEADKQIQIIKECLKWEGLESNTFRVLRHQLFEMRQRRVNTRRDSIKPYVIKCDHIGELSIEFTPIGYPGSTESPARTDNQKM